MILSKTRKTKALIRLRGCAGWSAPLLFANHRRQVFSRRGPFYFINHLEGIFSIMLTFTYWVHFAPFTICLAFSVLGTSHSVARIAPIVGCITNRVATWCFNVAMFWCNKLITSSLRNNVHSVVVFFRLVQA